MKLPTFHRWELVLVGAVIVVGSFLRLYRLPETLMFRGDQGRDALIAKRILKDGDIALIGPVTSVGNMYLGPFYYYFMVPFLALSYPSPLGPAYGVALTNIISLGVFYLVVRSIFSIPTALIATLLMAFMPAAVQYSRFSWNPNIAPLFAILLFWNLYRWWQHRQYKDMVLSWVWVGILVQLHYVSLTVVSVVGAMILLNLFLRREYYKSIISGLLGLPILIASQLPLIIFDFRHDHLISLRFMEFFTSNEKHIATNSFAIQLHNIIDRINFVAAQLMQVNFDNQVQRWLVLFLLLAAGAYAVKSFKHSQINIARLMVVIWLFTTSVGIAFYSHSVFAHYLTYTYPIIALFWAIVIMDVWNMNYLKAAAPVIFGVLIFFMAQGLFALSWTGLGTSVIEQTVKATLPHMTNPYNIVLLSDDRDYKGMSYRYFFEAFGQRPQEQENYADLSTLAIIDEVDTDDPLSVPIYEIQSSKDYRLDTIVNFSKGPRVLVLKKE